MLSTGGGAHYYKQLKRLEREGQVILSHPYDMSHLILAQISFRNTGNIKNVNGTFKIVDRSRAEMGVRTANTGRHRSYIKTIEGPPKTSYADRFSHITPRQQKQEWLKRASRCKER